MNLNNGTSLESHKRLLAEGFGCPEKYKHLTVAIVGAGMAGLVAAKLLRTAGFDITIYEASQRVGGRVKTLREGFSSDLYAEAGAMRIPESHTLTLWLCRNFLGLRLIDFPDDDNNALAYVNSRHLTIAEYNSGAAGFGRPYVTGRTSKKIFDQTMKYLSHPTVTDKKLDFISLGDYLYAFTQKGSTNPVTPSLISDVDIITSADIDLIGFEYGASELRASLLEAYRDHKILTEKKFQISNGMYNLPNRLVDKCRLGGSVRYNARVLEVRRIGEESFELTYEHPLTHSRSEPKAAQFVILAAPFSALTHVRLDQALDRPHLRAIRNLHYDNATKIALEFSERFWETRDNIHGGRSFTDLPVRWVHYPAKGKKPQPGEPNRGCCLPVTHGVTIAFDGRHLGTGTGYGLPLVISLLCIALRRQMSLNGLTILLWVA